jgi:hypothetical protein
LIVEITSYSGFVNKDFGVVRESDLTPLLTHLFTPAKSKSENDHLKECFSLPERGGYTGSSNEFTVPTSPNGTIFNHMSVTHDVTQLLAQWANGHSVYLVFMRGVDENHTYDFARIGAVIHADVVAAKGMTDKDVRRLLASDSKKGMEFLRDFGAGARHGTGSAPTASGAIVGADASKLRHFGLNEVPADGRDAKPAFKNHGGRTVAGTVEIERGVREFRAKGEMFSLL